jgi:hypothetical protein
VEEIAFWYLGCDVSALKKKIAACFDMSPTTYQTAMCDNSEDLSLNNKKMFTFLLSIKLENSKKILPYPT